LELATRDPHLSGRLISVALDEPGFIVAPGELDERDAKFLDGVAGGAGSRKKPHRKPKNGGRRPGIFGC
jgi:hypothetical protein